MAGTSIKYDLKELVDIGNRLLSLKNFESTSFLKRLRVSLLASTKERFEKKTDPTGQAWKSSNKSSGTTLIKSAILKNSIMAKSDDSFLEIGTNVIYAGIHQHGGIIKPKNGKALCFKIGDLFIKVRSVLMPKRSYLGLSTDDNEMIKDTLNGYLNRSLKV